MTAVNSVGNALTGTSGTGAFAGTTSPSFTTPALGTPSAGVLSSCTGYAQSALTGLGTGVSTALGSNVTGSGGIALATSPTFVTPILGVAAATSISFGGSALSAYTTGTWTPVLVSSGGGTFTSSFLAASYTIVGNRLIWDMIYNVATLGNAGNLTITGLPQATVNFSVASFYLTGAQVTASVVPMTFVQGSTINLYKYTTGTTVSLTTADIQAGAQLIISGVS